MMKVAIYGQYYKSEDKPYVIELIKKLEEHHVSFYFEEEYYASLKIEVSIHNAKTFSSHEELDDSFQFMITLGGDGTILRAVTLIRNLKIAIVGINTGRLGFLATVQKDHISESIDLLLANNYIINKRSLLSISSYPNIESVGELDFALNEVSLSRKNTASMITVETYLDEEYLTSYWADGLIVATPTGSTGYNLSCGGPIITPMAKSFALTPIAPHNLNARPLVIPDETDFKFKVTGREDEFFLSLDSRITSVPMNTEIHVKKADFKLGIVQFKEQTFLKTLREKLLWGQDPRN